MHGTVLARRGAAAAIALATTLGAAHAEVRFTITINEPTAVHASYYTDIRRTLGAAAADWAQYIDGSGVIDLEVVFEPGNGALMSAAANVAVLSGMQGETGVYQWGPVWKILTGEDPNPSQPDGVISINTNKVNLLWFDPSPNLRTAPIPPGRYDAYSIFLHEIGHILTFNGWLEFADPSSIPAGRPDPEAGPPVPIPRPREPSPRLHKCGRHLHGRLPWPGSDAGQPVVLDAGKAWIPTGSYMSTFDRYVETLPDGSPAFGGPAAVEVHGDAVPLDPVSYTHTNIPDSVMYTFAVPGKRDYLTARELAMLADSGVPMVGHDLPCPNDPTMTEPCPPAPEPPAVPDDDGSDLPEEEPVPDGNGPDDDEQVLGGSPGTSGGGGCAPMPAGVPFAMLAGLAVLQAVSRRRRAS